MSWREQSRKIIVYVSDDFVKFAGDGALSGQSLPNTGQCILKPDGRYDEAAIVVRSSFFCGRDVYAHCIARVG